MSAHNDPRETVFISTPISTVPTATPLGLEPADLPTPIDLSLGISLGAMLLEDTRKNIRDSLRTALEAYVGDITVTTEHKNRAQVILDQIRAPQGNDIAFGELLYLTRKSWDERSQKMFMGIITSQLGVFILRIPPLTDAEELILYKAAEGELSRVMSSMTEDQRNAFDNTQAQALKQGIEEAYTTYGPNLLRDQIRTALRTSLTAYIADIDSKTEAARQAGFFASATLYAKQTVGLESGPWGKSRAEQLLQNINKDNISLGEVLGLASNSWGTHSKSILMGILVEALNIFPATRASFTPKQLTMLYDAAHSQCFWFCWALSHQTSPQLTALNLTSCNHLKNLIERKYIEWSGTLGTATDAGTAAPAP